MDKTAYNAAFKVYMEKMGPLRDLTTVPDAEDVNIHHVKAQTDALELYKKLTINSSSAKNLEYLTRLKQDIARQCDTITSRLALEVRKQRIVKYGRDEYAIGIDLGTTFSCVTVYKDGKTQAITNDLTKKATTPSVVYFGHAGEIHVGEAALSRGFVDPANCISEVKRIIGRRYDDHAVQLFKRQCPFTVAKSNTGLASVTVTNGKQKSFLPEEISALVLKDLKRQTQVQLGCEVHDAVVTIPAYFTEPQRDATLRACKEAGLNVLRLFNEPTAAAMAYGMQNRSRLDSAARPLKVLVFDFGGGTCDVSILEMRGGDFVVKASYGDNQLGGEDYDNRLADHLAAIFKKQKNIKLDNGSLRRLRHMAQFAKCQLSNELEHMIFLHKFVGHHDLHIPVQRSTFEKLTKDLSERALHPVKECLRSAGLQPKDIDEIVMVGGSSRIPKVKELLRNFFKRKELNYSINPDEAIAIGAAMQAAILTGECEGISILDITPFSLGIEVIGDKFSTIINKNSQIPRSNTQTYVTTQHWQIVIRIAVYQGEDPVASRNTLLGEFDLTNLTRRLKGQTKISVTFKIDHDGILHVTANEQGKDNNKKSITINKRVNR